MRLAAWFLLAALYGCGGDTTSRPRNLQLSDGLPVSHADLRALFEHLEDKSGEGYECDHKYTLTRQFLAQRQLPVDNMTRWLGENGAGCDCEVILNVVQQWGKRVGFAPK